MEDRFEKSAERIQKLEESYQSFNVGENAVFALQNTVKEIQEKPVELEDRIRRNNLIVFGIPEAINETESDLREMVIGELFSEKKKTEKT